jgi:glyoxylase-like metal-dependent hydrolase (beta-lactamase superfamily II)
MKCVRLLCLLAVLVQSAVAVAAIPRLAPVDPAVSPDLFVWTDTCNVYVLRDGDAALLINLGDGGVLDQLAEIGVGRVEWVLFTHHHRELCLGASRLRNERTSRAVEVGEARIAAPEAEQALFERPTEFRKMNVRLGDRFTVHGASYVRPWIESIPLDRALRDGETFNWRGHELVCLPTPGTSPGAMTYRLRINGHWLGFSGGVMLDDARMHTWFDTEWDYGFAAGIRALRGTVARLSDLEFTALLPSHGPVVREPDRQLRAYAEKLDRLERLYVRGYDVEAGSAAYQDKVSVATVVSNVWQVSPSVFKFKRPNFWGNFGMILAASGRALVVDCGLLDERMLDEALSGMRAHFGLKAIDAVIISHMHGDHFLEAPYLRETWGAPIWALDNMVDKMERPEWFDYPASIQAYGKRNPDGSPMTSVRVDRVFRPGETFEWEGHTFTVDWMPGQTEFALCLHGEIDGRMVAFTGDNIFGDPENPAHTGHEAVVARNSAILEEGYIYAAEFLTRLQPDILIGGHSFVMDEPAGLIERYRSWSYEMRAAFQDLSSHPDYRYWFDPYWVRVEPYRIAMPSEGRAGLTLHLRNFLDRPQTYRVVLLTPDGVQVEPAVIEREVPAESTIQVPAEVTVRAGLSAGIHLVAIDVTVGNQRHGPLFDFMVGIP